MTWDKDRMQTTKRVRKYIARASMEGICEALTGGFSNHAQKITWEMLPDGRLAVLHLSDVNKAMVGQAWWFVFSKNTEIVGVTIKHIRVTDGKCVWEHESKADIESASDALDILLDEMCDGLVKCQLKAQAALGSAKRNNKNVVK